MFGTLKKLLPMKKNPETELSRVKKIPMLFILGHGRSGTTLLQSLLNGHPNIIAPPEYEFIIYFYARFGKIKHFKKADIIEFIEAIYSDHPHFSIWLMDRDLLTEKLLSTAINNDYPFLCKTLITLTGENKEDVKILSDKNAINSLFVKKLLKIFPDAKFVHMIRDPRDSVSGHIMRLESKNPFFLARRWQRYNIIIEVYKQKFPEKFFTIKYENMVNKIDEILISLSSFLDVTHQHYRKDNIVPEGFQSLDKNTFLGKLPSKESTAIFNKIKFIHENLSAPVNTAHIEKWRKEMSPHDIAVTEIITESCAKKYGYTIELKKSDRATISKFLLFKSKIIFYCWELFTRWRYDNYKFNTRYKAKSTRKIIGKIIH